MVEQDVKTDIATIGVLRSGDRAQIERFVRENTGWMHRVARRYLADDSLAEDCVQECFSSIFKSMHRFEHRSRLRSWLHKIVVNASLMKLRTIRRRREDPIEPLIHALDHDGVRIDGDWSDASTPYEQFDRMETAALVTRAIACLPDHYQAVVKIVDIEGLSTDAAADILHLSPSNVKVRLHRARGALRKIIAPALA